MLKDSEIQLVEKRMSGVLFKWEATRVGLPLDNDHASPMVAIEAKSNDSETLRITVRT